MAKIFIVMPEEETPALQPQAGAADRAFEQEAAEKQAKPKKELQFELYRLLLEKYADLINEHEKKTIGEIKGLVNADDLTIQSILTDFKKEGYVFQQNYFEAAEKVFQFVTKELQYVEPELNLNYWLAAKEVFAARIGDDEDLAVFLCSMLLGLGDENAAVVIAELNNLHTHAFVVTEFAGKFFILDPSQQHGFSEYSGVKEDAIQKYCFKKAKIKRFLYKFNHSTYEQFL
ncbi:MAG: hypothetical protein NTW59_00040 [Candidatus Diapherotrites archaeon]|nr:hypothetical protein [Candidatus Diapherotrites archaeon]